MCRIRAGCVTVAFHATQPEAGSYMRTGATCTCIRCYNVVDMRWAEVSQETSTACDLTKTSMTSWVRGLLGRVAPAERPQDH